MEQVPIIEHRWPGLLGAAIFSLGGGMLYILLYPFAFWSALGGLTGILLGLWGYKLLGKRAAGLAWPQRQEPHCSGCWRPGICV